MSPIYNIESREERKKLSEITKREKQLQKLERQWNEEGKTRERLIREMIEKGVEDVDLTDITDLDPQLSTVKKRKMINITPPSVLGNIRVGVDTLNFGIDHCVKEILEDGTTIVKVPYIRTDEKDEIAPNSKILIFSESQFTDISNLAIEVSRE